MSGDRGVSTVLDVAVCLLLISAGVVALYSATPPSGRSGSIDATDAAALLAASTVRVDYRLPPGTVGAGRPRSRAVRGTAASLLADAAVVDARGNRTPTFVVRVQAAVRLLLRRLSGAVDVVARVGTTTGSADRITVGPSPPPGVDVDAATISVGNVTILVRTWSR